MYCQIVLCFSLGRFGISLTVYCLAYILNANAKIFVVVPFINYIQTKPVAAQIHLELRNKVAAFRLAGACNCLLKAITDESALIGTFIIFIN